MILIVDDEIKIVQVLQAYLNKSGYTTLAAHTGKTALELFRANSIELVILDLMLPDLSGEEVCKVIRLESTVPIIMLTAKSAEQDLVQGLGIGADDYIIKPFSPRTIVAKVEALLRRVKMEEMHTTHKYENGDLIIDYDQALVTRQGKEIPLTPTEYKLLKTLTKAPGRIFSREQLISFALNDEFAGYDRTIDTYIKSLRTKIEIDRKNPRYILTVYGLGYKFTTEQ